MAFRTAKATRPKFTEDLNEFDSDYLLQIFKAIHAKDWGSFEEARPSKTGLKARISSTTRTDIHASGIYFRARTPGDL